MYKPTMFQIHICERKKCILSVKKTSKHKITSRTEDKIAIKKYISNLVKIVLFWKTSISYTQCQEMGKPKKIQIYLLYLNISSMFNMSSQTITVNCVLSSLIYISFQL